MSVPILQRRTSGSLFTSDFDSAQHFVQGKPSSGGQAHSWRYALGALRYAVFGSGLLVTIFW
jgi:hypothetical protein